MAGKFRKKLRRSYRRPKFAIRRRLHKKRIPMLQTIAALVPALDMVQEVGGIPQILQIAVSDPMWIGKKLINVYTGYNADNGQIDANRVIKNVTLLGAATIGHIAANKFGINRNLARVPYVGKYVEL